MTTITELVGKYNEGLLTFDEVLEIVPTLDWGVRHEEADEIWWEGDNLALHVDALFHSQLITPAQRIAIYAAMNGGESNHVKRWEISAKRNSPIYLTLASNSREGRATADYTNAMLRKDNARNRMNLWILGAGLLDVARYRNLKADIENLENIEPMNALYLPTDLSTLEKRYHWEASIDAELSDYIAQNHAEAFDEFRLKWKEPTNNFDFMDMCKTSLYFVMFNISDCQDEWNPVFLLEIALTFNQYVDAFESKEV